MYKSESLSLFVNVSNINPLNGNSLFENKVEYNLHVKYI